MLAQGFHGGADGFDILPIGFLSLRGDGFAEGGKRGVNIIPTFGSAGLLNFCPLRQDGLAGKFEFVFGGALFMGSSYRR
jgi:hypothetical protein